MSRVDHKFSRLLRLNSSNASTTQSNFAKGELVWDTNDKDLEQIRHVVLKSAIIPNSEYNIHSSNNVFSWEDAGTKSVTLPVGQYTLKPTNTFLTALNALVQAVTPTLVITQNAITCKINFTAGVNIEVQTQTTNPLNTMAQVLGITADSGVTMNFDSQALPDLVGLKHVYVVSNALSNQTQLLTGLSTKKKFPIFADIPINSAFGEYTVENTNSETTLDYSDFHSLKNCSVIDIKLVDETGRTIELNGLPWIIMARVYM
jgi:hypothetical protein